MRWVITQRVITQKFTVNSQFAANYSRINSNIVSEERRAKRRGDVIGMANMKARLVLRCRTHFRHKYGLGQAAITFSTCEVLYLAM